MKDLVWLDLCSGLGGASQPAKDHGWRVIRVDIDPHFKPDVVADVRALPLRPFDVDVLWASPPCQEFSKFGLRCFYPDPPKPDLGIAQAVRRLIEQLKPASWFVENVWASRPFLNKIFGPVTALLPGHAIWSNTLVLFPNIQPHKGNLKRLTDGGWGTMSHRARAKYRRINQKWWEGRGMSFVGTGHNGMAACDAAVVPHEIGEAICRRVER